MTDGAHLGKPPPPCFRDFFVAAHVFTYECESEESPGNVGGVENYSVVTKEKLQY